MPPKFCKDCRWFRRAPDHPMTTWTSQCTRPWHDLVTGEKMLLTVRPAMDARQNNCGVTGEGWEPKELLEEYDS